MMCKVLIFSCISAVMLMTAAYGAPLSEKKHLLETLINDLQLLEKNKDKIDLKLYTPNGTQECSRRTLQCYLTEIGTLENEIEEDGNCLQNIKKNLQGLMVGNLFTQFKKKSNKKKCFSIRTGCTICEANDKKEFPAFHQELTNFLRAMLK
ncbi:hypothetical protein N334_01776 [Pelecanus crispus]|uniref:Interleukin n=1 Tax=Pelecanus crispus TaxID=36300 RepID=A0A091STQ9_PELCR|nr:hypothetical protein N334_01776 [Pelecanus crispus]